ncbi:hypothetical protein IM774_00505 [Erysipelotrichaceae bacterium RD49]|nr:hypothetical protein [Erysipelotrichaceae bacterium RD49]
MAKAKYVVHGQPVYQPLIEFMLGPMQISQDAVQLACQLYTKKFADEDEDSFDVEIPLSSSDVDAIRKLDKVHSYGYYRYYPGKILRPRSELAINNCNTSEKDWIENHIALFTDSKALTKEEALSILVALTGRTCFYSYDSQASFVVGIWLLGLFDAIQIDPQAILKVRRISKEEFLVLQGIEPVSMRFLKDHMLPETKKAKEECAAGLQTRAIGWDEAAELFPLEEGTKVEFTTVRQMLNKLVPKEHPARKPKSGQAVYGIRQYNPKDWSLAAEFSPVNRVYSALDLDPAQFKFSLGMPQLIDGLITVKERMADLPNGRQYRYWMDYRHR